MKIKEIKTLASASDLEKGVVKFPSNKFGVAAVLQVWNKTKGIMIGEKGNSNLPIKASYDIANGKMNVDVLGDGILVSPEDQLVLVRSARGQGDIDSALSDLAASMNLNAQTSNQALELGVGGGEFIGYSVGDYSSVFEGDFFCIIALSDDVTFALGTKVTEGDIPPSTLQLNNGHTLYLPFTAIKLASGKALAYYKGASSQNKVVVGSLRA